MKNRVFNQTKRSRRSIFLAGVLVTSVCLHTIAPFAEAATRIHENSITPAIINFVSADPDSGTVLGSSAGTVFFRTTGGSNLRSWTVRVQSTSGSLFAGCPSSIPVNKVTITCTSATAGSDGTGSCGSPITLSTSPQLIASGTEGTGNSTPYNVTYTASLSITDSWSYIATTTGCTVNLSYEIVAN